MATRATDTRPTTREVTTRYGDTYILTLGASTITMRPKGTRSPKVRITIDVGSLYIRSLTAQIEEAKRAKRKARRGGGR